MIRSILTLSALALLAACAADEPATSRTASPARASSAHEIRRVEAVSGAAGVVDSILLFRDGNPVPVQTLRPEENGIAGIPVAERISTPDLDFDGEPDLALLSLAAAANSLTEYWRYDPNSGRFQPLGVFDTFRPDSAAREWTNFNRGGNGGRLWIAGRFRVVDGHVVQTRRETQDVVEDTDNYFQTISELRDGALVETSRRPVSESELATGPSWERKR